MKSIFVFNPESGKGKLKKYKDYIIKTLSEKYGEIECQETSYPGHAQEIAKNAVGKYDYFFVSGGDGTLNEVINGFGGRENAPIIGYIPSGTVNDVAHSLGISRNIKKAVKNLIDGEPFSHDIFKVNQKYGIYVCCTGLFTSSSYDTGRGSKKHLGKLAYFIKGALDIFRTKAVDITIDCDNGFSVKGKCALLLVLNSRSAAGFMLNKDALLNDGDVEIAVVHSKKRRIRLCEVLRCMGVFVFGLNRYKNSKRITYLKESHFKLTTTEGTIINLDGEKSGSGSFEFTVLQSAVKIIAPKKV